MMSRRSRRFLDPRDMKAAYVVSDENGYYDSQNIIAVFDKNLKKDVLSCVLHHSRNHEGGAGAHVYHIYKYWLPSQINNNVKFLT